MPVQSGATVLPSVDDFLGHWEESNDVLGAVPLIVAVPGKAATTCAQFDAVRSLLVTAQTTVQGLINDAQVARGDIALQKAALLVALTDFLGIVDGYYQATALYAGRPLMPGIGEGQERFTAPLVDAMTLWEDMNNAVPPDGVTLPVVLASGLDFSNFSSLISQLQFSYRAEKKAEQRLKIGRKERILLQDKAYAIMKAYRQSAPQKLSQHPAHAETIPKLTPDAGHTPDPVQASATLTPPRTTDIVHTASADADLDYYEVEGTNGDEFDDDDAVNLGRHNPDEPNEFTFDFGLTQPGTAIAVKVYVVLKTGRRAGSAVMVVRRVV